MTRVALVTGSARGLGAHIATALAAAGHAVACNDLDAAGARDTAARVTAAGGRARGYAADVTDDAAVDAMVTAVEAELGPVAVLVNNASGPQPVLPLADLTWPDVLAHLEFFAKAPLLLARRVRPGMQAAGFGRIVNIGSDLLNRGEHGWSAYMAAKGALYGLTRGWAVELGRDGITVNLVAPGWIPVERHADVPDEERVAHLARQAIPRPGRPADVAATVVFLASDSAGFVTGEQIVVNGGHHFS